MITPFSSAFSATAPGVYTCVVEDVNGCILSDEIEVGECPSANISEDNVPSLKLFQNNGFNIVGLKKDWICHGETYSNQYILQRISK